MSDHAEYGCDIGFDAGYQCGKDESAKRIATLEQQNAELVAALGMLIDLHDAAGMPAGPIRNNAQKTIAKVKQP